jgi:uncharacterized membrane protein
VSAPARARDPSRWAHRLPSAALALAGAAIASYLAAFQLDLLPSVWDPVFGEGSRRVLHSSFSKALPVPDALVGGLSYGVEILLDLAGGGRDRWRRRPRLVLAFGAVVAGAAAVSAGLVVLQAAVFHAFCTLCLASAALAFVIAGLAAAEVRAAVGVALAQRGRRPLLRRTSAARR